MSTTSVIHPTMIWAQRKNCILLTICLDDCKSPTITYEGSTLNFKGKGGSDQREHEAVIELFGNVVSSSSTTLVKPRNIELVLQKEEEAFWPRLTKSNAKLPWLKIDFNKWKDEDDSEDENGGGMPGMGGMGGMGGMPGMGGMGGMGGGGDFEEMMRQMGGLGGGMPGGGKPNLDDLDNHETDSDDEEEALPDLE